MEQEPNKDLLRRIRARFERELELSSVEANSFWQLKLFGETEEDFIRKEVERKLYNPELRNGGDLERRIVERLKKISRLKDFADAWRAGLALKNELHLDQNRRWLVRKWGINHPLDLWGLAMAGRRPQHAEVEWYPWFDRGAAVKL